MSTTLSVCSAINNGMVLDIPISVNFEALSGTATRKSILTYSFWASLHSVLHISYVCIKRDARVQWLSLVARKQQKCTLTNILQQWWLISPLTILLSLPLYHVFHCLKLLSGLFVFLQCTKDGLLYISIYHKSGQFSEKYMKYVNN